MSSDLFENFAYGSNMLSERLRRRVPSARVLGRATLEGYALRWHKVSQDGSGKCDIVRSGRDDARVIGVVYEIARSEKHRLDAAEGLGAGYDEMMVSVALGSGVVTAQTYFATRTAPTLRPYGWYKSLVVAGAREHALPATYIASLESVACSTDADERRRELHLDIVRAAGF